MGREIEYSIIVDIASIRNFNSKIFCKHDGSRDLNPWMEFDDFLLNLCGELHGFGYTCLENGFHEIDDRLFSLFYTKDSDIISDVESIEIHVECLDVTKDRSKDDVIRRDLEIGPSGFHDWIVMEITFLNKSFKTYDEVLDELENQLKIEIGEDV